ncbi:MAG: hypothetical protein KZQ86_02505 [Candidatus Thiodiazotropha sp. (ex Lucinoma kastoroae)]|nr:hypothetical protein [Candidatus Thiodiazotropha sp. (ex Lucinoma kastoroae)]
MSASEKNDLKYFLESAEDIEMVSSFQPARLSASSALDGRTEVYYVVRMDQQRAEEIRLVGGEGVIVGENLPLHLDDDWHPVQNSWYPQPHLAQPVYGVVGYEPTRIKSKESMPYRIRRGHLPEATVKLQVQGVGGKPISNASVIIKGSGVVPCIGRTDDRGEVSLTFILYDGQIPEYTKRHEV